MSEKKCWETGEPILSGRSDKRFIDDKARSKHHYLKNKEKNEVFVRRDKQLHINHFLLEKYYEWTKGERGIPLDFLEKQGFDPKVYFGPYTGLDSEPDTSSRRYSYKHYFTYDKESNKILIQKIQWRVKPSF